MNKFVARIRAAIAGAENERFDAQGRLKPDPTPLEVPLALLRRQQSINEQIKAALRSHEIQRAQEARGEETIDEMLDFGEDDGDDGLPVSPHEIADMRVDKVKEDLLNFDRKLAEARRKPKEEPKPAPVPPEPPKPF